MRTKEEYEAGHIHGAILHDVMDMMKGNLPLVDKNEEITVYCQSGGRSHMAKMILEKAGFKRVIDGEGIDTQSRKDQEMTFREKAEISIQRAKELILKTIDPTAIVSIYLKGSFVQDELRPESDVDIVVILKDEEYLEEVYRLTKEYGHSIHPPFQIVAYTMNELLTGEKATNRTKAATSVSRFVKHLDDLPLIHGVKPEGVLFTRSDKKDLSINIKNFKDRFIPEYKNGIFGFQQIIKQVFWLVEAELRLEGKHPEYSWKGLSRAIPDPDHIIHLTLTYRNQDNISKQEEYDFMNKLEKYLADLEELCNG